MNASMHVDLVPDEIILSRSPIRFSVPKGADTTELGRLISVPGVTGRVRASRSKGEFLWSSAEGFPPGRHRIAFEAMTNRRFRKLSDAVEIPFMVVESSARIPDRLRIESFSRVRVEDSGHTMRFAIDQRPRGAYVEHFKAVDRRSGKPVELAFDQDGKKLNPVALVGDYHKRTVGRYGKLDPVLAKLLRDCRDGDKVMVDVWLDVDVAEGSAERPVDECGIDRARERAQELRKLWGAAGREFAASLRDAKLLQVDPLAPLVVLQVPAGAIRELARRDDVARLMLHEVGGIDDLGDSIAIARSGAVHSAGETGAGIRVAVWEDGPTSNADLVIAGRFRSNPTLSDHSQNVHAIIRNSERNAPHGHAPGCSLYSANSKNRSALTWAVDDQDCTVINQSFHRSSEPGSDSLSGDDLYGDWLALHWPYPLIVHAAGNFWDGDSDDIDPPSDEYVNHKGYNTISVGNHNDDATAMRGSSVFRNPSSPHGDRELPEICANGTSVTATGITMTGTSQASPAVAGVAALLQERSAMLRHWPEGCRAILVAGATRNVSSDSWWRDVLASVDSSDGAGAVDARESHAIAGNRRFRGSPATRRGWDVGRAASDDFGADGLSKFEYRVAVPPFRWGPRNVRVALAWTSEVARVDVPIFGSFFFSALNVDLDLKVFDSAGRQVGYSGSWDNSFEIVEFAGRAGETYTIRIRRWSGDRPTWFGIAWTVTGGLMIEVPQELTEIALARA